MMRRILNDNIPKDELQTLMKFCIYSIRNAKLFLSGCFILIVSLFSNSIKADRGNIIYVSSDAVIVNKEYIFHEETPSNNNVSKDSSLVYIADNSTINGKEKLFVKHTQHNSQKTIAKSTSKTAKSAANNIIRKEPREIVLPDIPFVPSSYLQSGRETAATVSQQRHIGKHSVIKTIRAYSYPHLTHSNLSMFCPLQRQKLSIAATQCGVLTSFSPNSPTFV